MVGSDVARAVGSHGQGRQQLARTHPEEGGSEWRARNQFEGVGIDGRFGSS